MSFNVLTTHPNRFYPIGQKPLNEAFFISTGMKKRVSFYVDGFNFYYGLKAMTKSKPDWRKFYWINLVKLFEEFLNEDEELVCVNYFTARP